MFEVRDYMFLNVSPWKVLTLFKMKEKLKSRYIRPFKILQQVGEVAYRLALLQELSHVHDVYHIAMLRKYELNPSHLINFNDIELE